MYKDVKISSLGDIFPKSEDKIMAMSLDVGLIYKYDVLWTGIWTSFLTFKLPNFEG